MLKQNEIKKTDKKLVTSKTVFTVTMIVSLLTILSIWLFGLGQHRTLFLNSILSTSILSIAFFLFVTIGLYKGVKLKDDIGNLTDKLRLSKLSIPTDAVNSTDFIILGDKIEDIVFGIFLWLVVTVLIGIFIWLFGTIIWTGVIVFIAMLYWIFFRALRLVFKNSNKCKNNLKISLAYGLGYTTLYNFWIYAIILATQFLI